MYLLPSYRQHRGELTQNHCSHGVRHVCDERTQQPSPRHHCHVQDHLHEVYTVIKAGTVLKYGELLADLITIHNSSTILAFSWDFVCSVMWPNATGKYRTLAKHSIILTNFRFLSMVSFCCVISLANSFKS